MAVSPTATDMVETIRRIAGDALASAPDVELYDVEVKGEGNGRVVSVLIDKPGGVTIDDCAHSSRMLSSALDDADPIPGGYRLDVASPGAERQLRTPEHFRRSLGMPVKIKVVNAQPVLGTLVAADETTASVAPMDAAADAPPVTVALAEIVRARTVLEMDLPRAHPGRAPSKGKAS